MTVNEIMQLDQELFGRPGEVVRIPEGEDVKFFDEATVLTEQEHVARYRELKCILLEAYNFAAHGKGEERHGHGGLPWTHQRHAMIGNEVGDGFAIGQAVKKAFESQGLEDEPAVRELLGAITYLASAIYLIRQGKRHG